MSSTLLVLPALLLALAPSRPPDQGCKWEQLADQRLGLEVAVERCDYGFRKIDFFIQGNQLLMRYSDGGAPEPVIDVFELQPDETSEAGLQRIFAARTEKRIASGCKLAPYAGEKPRKDVKRYTFVPKVAAKTSPDEVGDPQCGDFGDMPDGIQYFEVQPRARRVLFVRVGQDTPLFDEQTLTLLH